jgi:hypothetical protein
MAFEYEITLEIEAVNQAAADAVMKDVQRLLTADTPPHVSVEWRRDTFKRVEWRRGETENPTLPIDVGWFGDLRTTVWRAHEAIQDRLGATRDDLEGTALLHVGQALDDAYEAMSQLMRRHGLPCEALEKSRADENEDQFWGDTPAGREDEASQEEP